MEPWRYFWKVALYILLVSEHTGSQMTFTSPEAPESPQDLTDSSTLESESNLEPETSEWISSMATTEPVSEVSTSADIPVDSYEMLTGHLYSQSLESSTPNAENPRQETTFFQATRAPADESRSTDSLNFAEASSPQPWDASTALSPPPIRGYAHFIHSQNIPTRKSSSGFRPPGTSMVKKGSTSAYLLSLHNPTGRMSHLATMELVSELSTTVAIPVDSYEMLTGHLHSLPHESSTPNAESPSQETTFFQANSAPADESSSTDSLSFAEASSAQPWDASTALSPPPIRGYAHFIHSQNIPTRKSSSGFRPPGTSMVKKGSTSAYVLSPHDPTARMSHPATMEPVSEVSTSAAIPVDSYEMLTGHLHSMPHQSSTPNAESPNQETTSFQGTSD